MKLFTSSSEGISLRRQIGLSISVSIIGTRMN